MALTRSQFVARELAALADDEKAVGMAGYMYGRRFRQMYPERVDEAPFYGVQGPGRKAVFAAMRDAYPVDTVDEYRDVIAELWGLPHHEERYLALAVASTYREFVRFPQLDVYRRLIVEGAWWDYVDEVAIRCVGTVLLVDRSDMSPVIDAWAADDDLWIRRSALIAHIKHKEHTDADQLFRHCRELAPEKGFFIRKAIGWALREYAKTDPGAVRSFVLDHEDTLSRLSFVEASKHLDL